VFREKLTYARDVRDGTTKDNSFLPAIYEFPKQMLQSGEHLKPENFYVTNPLIGRTEWGKNWIVNQLRIEQEKGPATRNVFLAKHLNVEIGSQLRLDAWVGAQFWFNGAQKCTSLDDLLRRSEVVTVGIDGGGLDDLLGFSVIGRERDTGKWLIWCRAWAHEIVLERRKSEAAKILDLVKEGTLSVVSEMGDDIEDIAGVVAQVVASGLLPAKDAVGVDRVGISDLAVRMMKPDVGVTEEQIVGVSQGWPLSGTIKTIERKLAANEIEHEGSGLMSWAVGNAKTEMRGNAITITKAVSGTAKIDPVMAMFDAAYLMGLNPEASGNSVYETRDMVLLS
jgi:phage terminase large subunit-like protein